MKKTSNDDFHSLHMNQVTTQNFFRLENNEIGKIMVSYKKLFYCNPKIKMYTQIRFYERTECG